MMHEFIFADVLVRAKESFRCKTDKALADVLGITPQVLGNRKKTESIPYPEIISAALLAGADVQYILTGVRSSNALMADEQLLLERYRSSPQAIKDAALRVLLIGGGAESSKPGIVIHGDVGQKVDTQTAKNITINMPKK